MMVSSIKSIYMYGDKICAIDLGDKSEVESLIERGAPLTSRIGYNGKPTESPLHDAILSKRMAERTFEPNQVKLFVTYCNIFGVYLFDFFKFSEGISMTNWKF